MGTVTIGGLTAVDAADLDDTALVPVYNNDSLTRKATLAQLRTALNTDKVLYLNKNLSTTSTADASLASYTLPAGTLDADGEGVRITVKGHSSAGTGGAGADNGSQVNIKFGSTAVLLHGSIGETAQIAWSFEVTILVQRTGAATQIGHGTIVTTNSTIGTVSVDRTTPAETLANAITIDFRGNAGTPTGGGSCTLFFDSVVVEHLYV